MRVWCSPSILSVNPNQGECWPCVELYCTEQCEDGGSFSSPVAVGITSCICAYLHSWTPNPFRLPQVCHLCDPHFILILSFLMAPDFSYPPWNVVIFSISSWCPICGQINFIPSLQYLLSCWTLATPVEMQPLCLSCPGANPYPHGNQSHTGISYTHQLTCSPYRCSEQWEQAGYHCLWSSALNLSPMLLKF